MGKVNFTVHQPAAVLLCDTCGERFIGADPHNDQATNDWMGKHAKWHEASSLRPPRDLVLP